MKEEEEDHAIQSQRCSKRVRYRGLHRRSGSSSFAFDHGGGGEWANFGEDQVSSLVTDVALHLSLVDEVRYDALDLIQLRGLLLQPSHCTVRSIITGKTNMNKKQDQISRPPTILGPSRTHLSRSPNHMCADPWRR